MELENILRGIKKKNRTAQKALYDQYSPLFMAIGMRYLKNIHEAEDAVAEAFIKIFTKVKSFKEKGSFEGWMKRIVVNECLMILRQKKKQHLYIPLDEVDIELDPEVIDKMSADEIMEVIRELPDGYRTVFNLYEIEGLKHREIAEELDISIHTSKSQLIMAKRKLREILKKNIKVKDEVQEKSAV
ncbi:RNA polymerase sigma factor [Membranicola marinus]|uniref:RNA polymerase sigma factor n=1 Tax=Membranihabitans marinus TaxID=1227546 RepID=A0A953HNP7_9BACT|nr:RNA polymerase sigma factor [Membranihabitans marinus]MBY5958459.1 RNA polymerase sigma factor [Membranihabitans marinus]